MLKYSFYLSKWFAGKKQDKIIPGTSFLFLNQISFLFLAIFLTITKLLPLTLSPKVATVIAVSVTLAIMYGFPKNVQAMLRLREQKYEREYNTLTINKIYVNRIIALFLFALPFLLCFVVLISFYR